MMRKSMKRSMVALLLMVTLVMNTVTVQAASSEYDVYAERLSQINVFKGTGSGFDLDRAPTRLEGLVMLIRLLGVEEDANALKDNPTHFVDVPQWGIGYVNYAYANGLTNGISDTEFGTKNLMQAKSYMTFLLRALGYDDKAGDFTWAEANEFALNVGILDENTYFTISTGQFIRGHVAKTSYQALQTETKDSNFMLVDQLVAKGAIDQGIAATLFTEIVVEDTPVVVGDTIDLAQLSDSCVYIEVTDVSGNVATGSGFYISSDGKIVTNYHVIENGASIVIFDNDGTKYTGDVTILGYSSTEDIAIIKTSVTGKQPVKLGNSNNVKLAEQVYAIGSPKGLINTVSEGIISNIRESDIQISAPISQGSSGGALFNMNSEVIGITYAGIIEGENLGFVIPINKLNDIDMSRTYTLADLFGSTAVVEKPVTVVDEADTVTPEQLEAALNENVDHLIINEIDISVRFFEVELDTNYENETNVYVYLDAAGFAAYNQAEEESFVGTVQALEENLEAFETVLGTNVFFSIVYIDEFDSYPSTFATNGIFDGTITETDEGTYFVYYAVALVTRDDSGEPYYDFWWNFD